MWLFSLNHNLLRVACGIFQFSNVSNSSQVLLIFVWPYLLNLMLEQVHCHCHFGVEFDAFGCFRCDPFQVENYSYGSVPNIISLNCKLLCHNDNNKLDLHSIIPVHKGSCIGQLTEESTVCMIQ